MAKQHVVPVIKKLLGTIETASIVDAWSLGLRFEEYVEKSKSASRLMVAKNTYIFYYHELQTEYDRNE